MKSPSNRLPSFAVLFAVLALLAAPAFANGPTPPPAGSGDMDIEPPASAFDAVDSSLIHEQQDVELPVASPEAFIQAKVVEDPPFWDGWLEALLDAIPGF